MFGTEYRRYGSWYPWQNFHRLQNQINSLFGNFPDHYSGQYPAINVWQNHDDTIITAEIPGVKSEDLDIDVQGETLTIRGQRKIHELQDDEKYHRQERENSSFVRAIQLPYHIDVDKVRAKLEKGLLQLTLPRAQSDKPKKVKVLNA
ncbi:MAG: Hsp20/alpha crystallin family protein [Phycisphaerae bacterium]|nr:Hsp20/alpha crystallin family protein [Phycisphaerae bacterium]